MRHARRRGVGERETPHHHKRARRTNERTNEETKDRKQNERARLSVLCRSVHFFLWGMFDSFTYVHTHADAVYFNFSAQAAALSSTHPNTQETATSSMFSFPSWLKKIIKNMLKTINLCFLWKPSTPKRPDGSHLWIHTHTPSRLQISHRGRSTDPASTARAHTSCPPT